MSNINLLPDDLKKVEEKEIERISKRPKINKVEWNNPVKDNPANLYSDAPEESLWSKIFGANKTVVVPKIDSKVEMQPKEVMPVPEKSKSENAYKYSNVPNPPVSNKKSFSFSDIFGVNSATVKLPSGASSAGDKIKTQTKVEPSPISEKKDGEAGSFWEKIFGKRKKFEIFEPVDLESAKISSTDSSKMNYEAPKQQTSRGYYNTVKTTTPPNAKNKKMTKDKVKTGKYHLAPKKEASGININLIPEELISVRKPSFAYQATSMVIVIFLSAIIVGGLYYFIDFQQKKINSEIAAGNERISQLNVELKQYHQEQNQNRDTIKKILSVNGVLKNHLHWTKFFTLLEKYTLDDVHYSGFSANVSGKFALPVSAKDYASALSQISAFKQASDFTKDVEVDSMHILANNKKGAYAVGFDLKMTLADSVFKK